MHTAQEIVSAAYLDRVDLCAHGFYATPDITGFGGTRPFNYLCYGAQLPPAALAGALVCGARRRAALSFPLPLPARTLWMSQPAALPLRLHNRTPAGEFNLCCGWAAVHVQAPL